MKKVERNAPCPCGSGKKYKQCCLKREEALGASKHADSAFVSNTLQEAIAHHQAGRLVQAEMLYQQILQKEPDHPEALHFLGMVAFQVGRAEIAVDLIGRSLAINPASAEPHANLGGILQMQGKVGEAVEHFHAALSLKHDYPQAHNNLGNALKDQGNLSGAVEHFLAALSIQPDYPEPYSNLLFLYAYHASLPTNEYLSLARGWELACVPAHERLLARDKTFRRSPLAGRRLRVGYVSGDYRQHAVSYFIEQLFARHDRARIELFAYSTQGLDDAVTERLRAQVEHWVSIYGMSDAMVLDRIESDAIDVLIDLSGHTLHNRMGVFARRAAPVQAHYLGYFASTGLAEMDYWIGDEILTPPEADSQFCEKLWRLPRVWVSYKTIADAPAINWSPGSDGSIWVGSFNNLGKLTPQTLALWAKVLHALPEGRLLLKTKELADHGNRQRILAAMANHGILPDRIELQRESNWADYMSQYNRLDIALDPVGGHGGGTITCDALWMGVPVVHALGDRASSRFTASMLNAIGHPEWIAGSEEDYVAKVVTLARDLVQRKALRFVQRERMASSPLCDAVDLAKVLEAAYVGMFERWLESRGI